jgi:drug/metabolite transporter (DMT)-like permease
MARLLGLGLLAALFFSSTFLFNRFMSLGGGHWFWSAALRYAWMALLLIVILLLQRRLDVLRDVARQLRRRPGFWLVAGTVGFGIFYAGVSFAAGFAPSWVLATTWQLTILMSPIVLAFFGRRVPVRGFFFTALIFAGIVLVNLEQAQAVSVQAALLGIIPMLISAIAYPTGLQMVWEDQRRSPPSPALENSFGRVLLLTLASAPFWLLLGFIVQPPPVSTSQVLSTLGVAIFSGVIATTLFVAARQLAHTPYQLAAVDATQSGEVIFSLAGELLLLNGALPGNLGLAGIAITLVGLVLYLLAQGREATPGAGSAPV